MTTPDRHAPESCGCDIQSIQRAQHGFTYQMDHSACRYPETVEALAAAQQALVKAGYDLSECREALLSVEDSREGFCRECGRTKGHGHDEECFIGKALAFATERAK